MKGKRVAAATETVWIGPELKRLREAAGLSLRVFADRSGFSPSFISQVENGQASPSIGSLGRMAAVLNVTLSDFFAVPEALDVPVVRADARPRFRSSWSKARIDSLTSSSRGLPLEALMVTLDPGGASGKHPEGVARDQLAVVFSGALTLTLKENQLELDTGDSVFIHASTPHRWMNNHGAAAEVLLVSPRKLS
jgi:transcriptional regulator with XRE-family HTH domain